MLPCPYKIEFSLQAFFQRMQGRKEPPLPCKVNGNCVIDRERRKCAACRLQKCIYVGMNINGKVF